MLNEEIATILVEKYGTENFKIYCQMEIEKSKIFQEEARNLYGIENSEFEYDTYWWQKKYEQLLNQENH